MNDAEGIEWVRGIEESTYRELLPLAGRLLEGLYARWFVAFGSLEEIVEDHVEGYDKEGLLQTVGEFDKLFASGIDQRGAEALLARLGSAAPPGRDGLDALQWIHRIRQIVLRATTAGESRAMITSDPRAWNAEILRRTFPSLAGLLPAVFCPSWEMDYDGAPAALRDALDGFSEASAIAIRSEIRNLLDSGISNEGVSSLVLKFNANIDPAEHFRIGGRAFLVLLADAAERSDLRD
ncbi:hypothetical protein GCM10017714_09670 [Curtobacterium pusillum]|uniref:CdiI immunity protein domain-containing protein n=1 Tax=Curtobacterium pusillum TaxID=69373 RepID=A0ABX2M3P6_9MICO|nr:contact-dependent growth inhibition system immunity protein [Curtobacterium pusillum]NUU12764.1 hypothetical protein [Curtobacterium pusillum]GLK30229.1 hypothetical protein GCM10017610_05140 [Curtobacterium pusillum]